MKTQYQVQRMLKNRVRIAVTKLGRECTHEEVCAYVKANWPEHNRVTRSSFEKRWQEVYGGRRMTEDMTRADKKAAVQVIEPPPPPIEKPTPPKGGKVIATTLSDLDAMKPFLRFMGVVAEIGGVTTARAYLDQMEALSTTLANVRCSTVSETAY